MMSNHGDARPGSSKKSLLSRPTADSGASGGGLTRRGVDMSSKRRIGQLLLDSGLIDERQLQRALRVQEEKGGKVVEILISQGSLDTDQFVEFLARQPGVASLDLSHYEVARDLVQLVPREIAIKHELFPIDRLGRLLTIGMVCPLDSATIREIETITGLRVKALLCSAKDIREAIERYYPQSDPEVSTEISLGPVSPSEDVHGLKAPIRLRNVATLIHEVDTLPALPETVKRVQEATLDPLSSVRDVADIIVLDPPIAAKVLSVANSAAYGFPQRVDDISLAVALLGLRETYSIVLSAAVVNMFEKSKNFDYKSFWVESMCCAGATRIVSKAARRKHQVGVFSAGLLHDIGRLALSEISPELYAKVPKELSSLELVAAEEEIIGLSHTEAGYLLAERWGLPVDIVEPIRFHHRPELAVDSKENVAIVTIASAMAYAQGASLEENTAVFEDLKTPMAVLRLDFESAEAMLVEYLTLRNACLSDSLS